MQITHFGHSCVLVETGSARLLIDPGTFSADFEDLRELDAVLVTHQHPDHLDLERLPALLAANPDARLVVDPGSVASIAERGLSATTARPGDVIELGGAAVNVVGGEHAVIHPDIPVVDNIGYVVDHGAFYHPGDSFFVPEQRIDVLGLPTAAPWLKLSEAIDFLRAVAPRTAVPIHEAVLAVPQMHYRMFEQLGPEGTAVEVLTKGTPTGL
ncbi:L-ascorbate metabolism protein UlaG, beta-lactamase superfamily [Saccharopolyspora antimicrobica]|uniref:L-ascorbate metabolism protein UlaG (Beta-lactamase superfamily) n=1 Tax=Saccharopolyspora antimicrobica TaxID=455193 RepID=A0A1I5JMW5_9PSEU|nr:MBL fold metallo-hydrolase [Saccharopolyspora antimicrobica]RKT84697.1 L-ascorbate metabolism protein UlaG (beta-lactamase superfamily) [Saccharopolyspora antimicrobica]SFO74142.1 L-ascorbate metabolism protein UlaG, beta-lactamase superfamily [Saccharopolyspora antimicrobica]